jgi:hypothetical protein
VYCSRSELYLEVPLRNINGQTFVIVTYRQCYHYCYWSNFSLPQFGRHFIIILALQVVTRNFSIWVHFNGPIIFQLLKEVCQKVTSFNLKKKAIMFSISSTFITFSDSSLWRILLIISSCELACGWTLNLRGNSQTYIGLILCQKTWNPKPAVEPNLEQVPWLLSLEFWVNLFQECMRSKYVFLLPFSRWYPTCIIWYTWWWVNWRLSYGAEHLTFLLFQHGNLWWL